MIQGDLKKKLRSVQNKDLPERFDERFFSKLENEPEVSPYFAPWIWKYLTNPPFSTVWYDRRLAVLSLFAVGFVVIRLFKDPKRLSPEEEDLISQEIELYQNLEFLEAWEEMENENKNTEEKV